MSGHSWFTTLAVCVLLVLLPAVTVTIVAYLVMIQRLFVYLRRHHPGKYQDLGEPDLFFNNSPFNDRPARRRTMSFIKDGDYSLLDDPTLTRLGDRTRRLLSASKSLFIATLIALFSTWFSGWIE